MRAMILAAGFGTRLHPITEKIPKALVPINGKAILEHQINLLEHAGFTKVAVNAHHFADQVKSALELIKTTSNLKICYSHEPEILNTGGGIKKMLQFFPGEEPVLVQNVDILCSVNYQKLLQSHIQTQASATLVVNNNQTDRPLAFSDEFNFLGRAGSISKKQFNSYCFCGIQVIQPDLFNKIKEDNFYSIDVYCNAVQATENITGYDITGEYWRDIGTINDLKMAEDDIRSGALKF